MDSTLNRVPRSVGGMSISLPEVGSGRSSFVERTAPALLLGADVLACGVAWMGAASLLSHSIPDEVSLVATPMVLVAGIYVVGGYDRRTEFRSVDYFCEHLIASFGAVCVVMLFTYLVSSYHEAVKPSRLLVPTGAAIFSACALWVRRVVGGVVRSQRMAKTILVFGEGEEAKRFYRDYRDSGLGCNLRFIAPRPRGEAVCLDGPDSPLVEPDPVRWLLGGDGRYRMILIACAMEELSEAMISELAAMHCGQTPVLTVRAFKEEQWRRVDVGAVQPTWLFDCEFALAQGGAFHQLKRAFDVVFSICALLLLLPLLLGIGVLVAAESRGGAIFSQERVGLRGRVFNLYKFRTMHLNEGAIYTTEQDPRVTRAGRWLRRSRLDELPQLWNVLRGEMSLIGPRAEWVRCVEEYAETIPHYHLRHLVKPGISGWAQVNYRYGAGKEDAIQKFQYDLYYLRYFSLKLDVSILVKTVYTMLARRGR
jgi:exopolysaccharide biosynthesis polyprenyl glycosylphosphotransferase